MTCLGQPPATLDAWLARVDKCATQMGGADWGGHTCPDPVMGLPGPRSRQRPEIIRRARGADMPLTTDDIDLLATSDKFLNAIADRVESRYGAKLADGTILNRDVALAQVDDTVRTILAKLNATVTTGGTIDVAGLAKAVADELARRLAT